MAKRPIKKELESAAEQEVTNSLSLANLSPAYGSRHRRKIVGRGESSGWGKTSGKGGKGQTARSGATVPRGFEGGQMPLHRRLPKRGFTSLKRVRGENVFALVSLAKLLNLDVEGEITVEVLREKGLAGGGSRIKILGGSEVNKKLSVEAHAISASARKAIEEAGGTVNILSV